MDHRGDGGCAAVWVWYTTCVLLAVVGGCQGMPGVKHAWLAFLQEV